jgi:hypothetical protein
MEKKDLIKVYQAVYDGNKEFLEEFKSIAPINIINLSFQLDIELNQRVIRPLRQGKDIDIDDKNLGFINIKINKLLDTLDIYKGGYQQNKIDKKTMTDYLVGNSALEQIRAEMNNSTQVKEEATQVNVRKNK